MQHLKYQQSVFSFISLETTVFCIQENCKTKTVERINREIIQINQSQATIDIAAKLTRLPEKFSIQSAMPLAIVLFSVFPSCSQNSSDWWHLRKCQLLPFLLLWHVYWILTRRSLNYVAPLGNVEAPRVLLTVIYRGFCQY